MNLVILYKNINFYQKEILSDHSDDIHGEKYLHAFSSEFDKNFINNMDTQCQYCDFD